MIPCVKMAQLCVLGLFLAQSTLLASPKQKSAPKISYQTDIQPLIEHYCYACHGNGKTKGDLALDNFKDEGAIRRDLKTWEKVLHNLRTGEMPPEKKPQPTQDERDRIANWVEGEVFKCDCEHPDPGRVTLRRLNRAEYNNTIRDLVGVDFKPAEDFPADDVGYGFDNIGDVLSLPPVLLEKYLTAAEAIMDAAIITGSPSTGPTKKYEAAKLESSGPGDPYGSNGARILTREGDVSVAYNFPKAGDYILRVEAFGQQAGPEPAKMDFRIDGKTVSTVEVKAVESSPKIYEFPLKMEAGVKKLGAAYINNYLNPSDPNPENRDRNLIIDYLEVEGPLGPQELPASHLRIFPVAVTPENKRAYAREIVSKFTRRAYRRPVSSPEIDRLMQLFEMADKQGESFEQSVKVTLEAVLISPDFLFRGESQSEPNNPASMHLIDEYALASRLSYFLWSTMPDEELMAKAAKKTLRRNLASEVTRLLKDPKSKALVENFADQWLQIRNLMNVSPDEWLFPEWDASLRGSMQRETELFFEGIMREDRSILDFLSADYTFVNERLAQHYGIEGVHGEEFRKVSLKGQPRGGLLTQASILTITSNPTRTSPVKRGRWVLENILGTPPPPPPPGVPELKEGKELTGTLRERMEQHRANTLCASCHARMDPLGFGLENFNAIGGWRKQDGKNAVDSTGVLVSGESFNGALALKQLLAQKKRTEFVRCLSEKVLTYALGRGLEYYDKCALDQMTLGIAKGNYRFSSLILEAVKSPPFQMRRGEGERVTVTAR